MKTVTIKEYAKGGLFPVDCILHWATDKYEWRERVTIRNLVNYNGSHVARVFDTEGNMSKVKLDLNIQLISGGKWIN